MANYNTSPPQILSFQYIAPPDFESLHRAWYGILEIQQSLCSFFGAIVWAFLNIDCSGVASELLGTSLNSLGALGYCYDFHLIKRNFMNQWSNFPFFLAKQHKTFTFKAFCWKPAIDGLSTSEGTKGFKNWLMQSASK